MNAPFDDLPSDLDFVITQLLAQARDNTRLAAILRRQALRILDNLDGPEPASHGVRRSGATSPQSRASAENLNRLLAWSKDRHGKSASGIVSISGEPPDPDQASPERYQELAAVCRLKARAADWRACALSGDEAPVTVREDLIHEASDTGVFLWTVTRSQDGQLSRNALDYQRLADTYWACTEALEAWGRLPLSEAREILSLIAEAQSMIRVAASRTGHRRREDTAEAVHGWLCEVAAEIQVYIPRFMKAGEAADPHQAAELRERVSHLLDSAPAAGDDETSDDDDSPPTGTVARVRELLRHRTVALFCGDRRADKRQQLTEAFELNDLLWNDGCNGDSDPERIFERPDLDLVLLALRWLDQDQADTLARRAAERGVPVVWLKGGYGVKRVAQDILEQAGEQLANLA